MNMTFKAGIKYINYFDSYIAAFAVCMFNIYFYKMLSVYVGTLIKTSSKCAFDRCS